MKKLFLTTAMVLIMSMIASATERIITFEELPKTAQEFVKTHFKDLKISYIQMDRDITNTEYTVRFDDNTKIEFDGNGDWNEISSKTCLPTSIFLENILKFINDRHAGACITECDKDWNKLNVELNNKLEITFNSKGEFLRYDD